MDEDRSEEEALDAVLRELWDSMNPEHRALLITEATINTQAIKTGDPYSPSALLGHAAILIQRSLADLRKGAPMRPVIMSPEVCEELLSPGPSHIVNCPTCGYLYPQTLSPCPACHGEQIDDHREKEADRQEQDANPLPSDMSEKDRILSEALRYGVDLDSL